jgi:hypothetical protein
VVDSTPMSWSERSPSMGPPRPAAACRAARARAEVEPDGADGGHACQTISQPQGARVRPDIPLHLLYARVAPVKKEGGVGQKRPCPAASSGSRQGKSRGGFGCRRGPPAFATALLFMGISACKDGLDDDGIGDASVAFRLTAGQDTVAEKAQMFGSVGVSSSPICTGALACVRRQY